MTLRFDKVSTKVSTPEIRLSRVKQTAARLRQILRQRATESCIQKQLLRERLWEERKAANRAHLARECAR